MIQLRTVCLSAHLDSFCRRLNELEQGAFEFVYTDSDPGECRRKFGWRTDSDYRSQLDDAAARERALRCDLLIDMLREPDLFEQRSRAGLPSIYICERWFKPIPIYLHLLHLYTAKISLPGHLRLLVPRYRRMARRFVALMEDPLVQFLPCGVHAVRDFVRLYKLLHGDLLAWFRPQKVKIDRQLGGAVAGFPRIRLWGYFVEPSTLQSSPPPPRLSTSLTLRVLWVGRMLDWKRVDVLIKAFRRLVKVRSAALIIAGEGPERNRLEKLAGALRDTGLDWRHNRICFNDYIPNAKVRELMREADAYVMPSNAEEGWGAVVSDALAEGCRVISTFEAGSSATLLPVANLYHASSVSELTEKLLHLERIDVVSQTGDWTGARAAEKLRQNMI